MAITLQDNIFTSANKPSDSRYGPYTDVASAISSIPSSVRHEGLTVGIITNSVLEEYWFKDGTEDIDLVPKKSGIEEISDLISLETYTGDASQVYVVQENAIYRKSNLKDAEVTEDGLNVIHSDASDYSWVRNSHSNILNIRDLYDSDSLTGTDDSAVFKKAFAACNSKAIYQKAALNEPNPHFDTVYIPEGEYSIEETIEIRCNVISSPNAFIRFAQKSILDDTWRDHRALFKIGSSGSDYAYDTTNYKVDNDPFANETNLHRWIELDSIIRLGPMSMDNTTQTITSCVKIDSNYAEAKESYQDLRDFLKDKVPGYLSLKNFELDDSLSRGATLTTYSMAKSNAPTDLSGRLKILLLDLDSTTNEPVSGIIYDRNYWDDSVAIVENSIDADTAEYEITLRVVDINIRQLYQQSGTTTELVGTYRRAYLYHDNKDFSYFFEPDCVSKEENFHLPKVIAADSIQVDGSNERFIFFDQAGRYNLDESSQESPYLRGKVRTTSEGIVNEIKGFSIELPKLQHKNSINHWPIFQKYKNVEADYSVAILINGVKDCYIKCTDARFFSTYMHLMSSSLTVGQGGLIGCTLSGGNCANNKRQIEILAHRQNGNKVGGYVNSNKFVNFTMNWAADNHMKDGSKQAAHITADSIVSLEDIYSDLLSEVKDNYTGNERLLCVKFGSRYPVLKRLSYFADSNGNALSAQAVFSTTGTNTLTLEGDVANLGLDTGVNIYVTDSINTEGLWGQVASFTYDAQNDQTVINITRDPNGITALGTDPQFYFYGTFDIERAKPNYYMHLNDVQNALNSIAEFRIDHITELQDGSGNYVIITNYGEGDPIYGDNQGRSQDTWTPESNNPNLYAEIRYARLGSHPTHRDINLPDYIRKDYQLVGIYGTQQIGRGSPNGNIFYDSIFEEHAALGYKHYDLIGCRYTRFIHIRAEVGLRRTPENEFRNTVYIDGCSKIQFDSGFNMEHSVVYKDTRDLLLPRPSDSIIFDANNSKSFDLSQSEYVDEESVLIKPVYTTLNGSVDIDYADVTYGPNSKVTINKKVFEPTEKVATILEEFNRQIVNLKYSSEIRLPATSTSFSVDVVNSSYKAIKIVPEAGVTFRSISSGNPLTTNEYIIAGGSARFTNLGNNNYNVSGDLVDVADGLSATYQTILSNTGTTNDLTNEQKLAQDIFIRTLEGTGIWNKITKLGIFGGMSSAAGDPDPNTGKGMSLINWKNSGVSTQTVNGVFTLQGSPVVQDNSLPVYDADTTQDFGFEYVSTGNTAGTISYDETIFSIALTTPSTITGTGYTTADDVPTSGGTGSGLTVNIQATNGDIDDVTINDPGSGYSNGDEVTIVQGNGASDDETAVLTTAFTGLMKYTSPLVPYNNLAQRIQLPTNAPELDSDYLDAGKLYKVQMDIYMPSTNNAIDGVRLLTNDTTAADPVVTYSSITTDTWTQIEYVIDSAGGAVGNAFQIRFIQGSGNLITDPDTSSGDEDEVYFRNFSIIPLVQTTGQNNPWTEEYGFSANRAGSINTHADSLSTEDNITIFAYQSLPAERAAALIQNAAGVDLYADLNNFEEDGEVIYLDPQGSDGRIDNSGFGVGNIIYFNDDVQNTRLGTVAAVISKTSAGTRILVEDIRAVPSQGQITWRTIEPRSNQVQFGITGTKQKFLKLYADTRTNDISLFNDRIRDGQNQLIYFDTTQSQALALTRQSGNSTDLELFRNGVTTTIDAPKDSLATNLTDLLIFQSNEDIADDFAMGGFVIAQAMTNEEITILQNLFKSYYS